MTLDEVCVQLGLGAVEEPFARGWEDSERSFPDAAPFFLSDSFIVEGASLVSLDDEAVEALLGAAKRVRRDAALAHLLWHEHRLFCGLAAPTAPGNRPRRRGRRSAGRPGSGASSRRPRVPFLDDEHDPSGFPELVDAAVEGGPALNLLVALSAVPSARSFYERRHLPEVIFRETLADFAVWVRYYRERLGYIGINVGTLSWLRYHLQGRLFRIGRLQYMQGEFTRDLTVYRSTTSPRVTALAAAGLNVDDRGLLLIAPDEAEPSGEAWTTRRSVREAAVIGNPIGPSGTVSREEVELSFDEYLPVLRERTAVLEVHIPEGGPMSPEECGASVSRASQFFREYFPERAFSALTCEAWFLGRELLDLLAAGSNMRSFADELYLYPRMGTEEDAIARLFGPHAPRTPPSGWPRATSLQRAVADRVEAGGRIRPGGGFLLADDLPWGQKVYRAP